MQSSLVEALGYVGKEELSQIKVLVESNPLLGYVSLKIAEDAYQIEDINVDEGKHKTVVTITLTPNAMLKGKGRNRIKEEYIG